MSQHFNFQHSYQTLPAEMFAAVAPARAAQPELVFYNHTLAEQLGISPLDNSLAALYLSGKQLPANAQPIAQAYAGHQFGHATMLGDGRAILLGEQITPAGNVVDIQLKGAGPTPFSRRGDGRATLGSVLREYLISEAMAALGVPTSRSLAVVATGEAVRRPQPHPGAVLTRVASSHLRVGTFQYAAWHPNKKLLPALVNYAIKRHYPTAAQAENPALALLEAVMEQQIRLIVHWLRVGFIHGVMNTDNSTISGETLDYGPCAFMDTYHPNTVFSSIDHQGRYAFGQQAAIAQWNLERLAEALLTDIHPQENTAIQLASAVLDNFTPRFTQQWVDMMHAKLGLMETANELVDDWLTLLQNQAMDYTNAHRALMRAELPQEEAYHTEAFIKWWQRWRPLHDAGGQAAKELMQAANPAIIPRNHQVNQALNAAEAGDLTAFSALHQALGTPYQARDLGDPFTQAAEAHERVTQTFCGT